MTTNLTFILSKPLDDSHTFMDNKKSVTLEESAQREILLTRPYRTRSGWKATEAIANNYVSIASCIAICEIYTQIHGTNLGSTILYIFTVSIIASRMRALENLVHEASHNNLFATPALHQHLQFLYAFPVFRIVQDYRRTHLLHHKYLGDPRKDPDILRLFGIGLDRLPEKSFWDLFGLPITGFLTYEYITTTFLEFWRSSTCWLSKSGFWASILMILALQELLLQFIYYYLVPFLVILPVIRYWAEISEHLGLDLRSCLGSSRTNIGFIHRWYLNPHNDGYHTVHHLCSQVPFYLLPRAHKQLMERSMDFAGKSVVSYGVRETFGQMMVNKTRTKE